MTDPIDYSRPVGWWCAYCNEHFPCERARMWLSMACNLIPIYLPIPEGQRPLVEDEVESAEVVIAEHYGDVRVFSGADHGPDGTGRESKRWALAWDTEADQWDLHAIGNYPTVCFVTLAVAVNYIVTGATE